MMAVSALAAPGVVALISFAQHSFQTRDLAR
jgi:hypothetical protein